MVRLCGQRRPGRIPVGAGPRLLRIRPEQDSALFRPEYLRTALEISDVGDSAICLLNPEIRSADGEWEAWFFANWLPGATRYRSFREMMEAHYEAFQDGADGF